MRKPSYPSNLFPLAGRFPKKVLLVDYAPGDREYNRRTINDIRKSARDFGCSEAPEGRENTSFDAQFYTNATFTHAFPARCRIARPPTARYVPVAETDAPAKPKLIVVASYDEAFLANRV